MSRTWRALRAQPYSAELVCAALLALAFLSGAIWWLVT